MPDKTCAEHSGMMTKINMVLWITGIGTAAILSLFPVAFSIQTDITKATYLAKETALELEKHEEEATAEFAAFVESNHGRHLREQARLRDLEKYSHEHTGGL